MLLHLVPLVQVAWSEGEVTARERDLILALAERRGVPKNTATYRQLAGWLDDKPTDDFFDTALTAIRSTLDHEDEDSREADLKELAEWAVRIAEAAGGMLGMARVCREERECLKRITERLTAEEEAVAVRRLSSMTKQP